MKRLILPLFLLALLLRLPSGQVAAQFGTPTPTAEAPAPAAAILVPEEGQAVQGVVEITGNSAVDGFQSAELAFGYHNDATHTWFLIAESLAPVEGGPLASWDTTTITDGEYDLRLSVRRSDGSQSQATVAGVRVRNYTPVETDTPVPVLTLLAGSATHASQSDSASTPTPTSAPGAGLAPAETVLSPTATALPPDPAQLTGADVLRTLGKGALVIFGLFTLVGIYGMMRRRK